MMTQIMSQKVGVCVQLLHLLGFVSIKLGKHWYGTMVCNVMCDFSSIDRLFGSFLGGSCIIVLCCKN